jgi:hypothetical protein
MKMVKGLLLGTAAGMVAVAGAQAADLPVKAKPVEYVKICSVYGEGFFYVPGTDTCIKIGGYVRQDVYFGQAGGSFRPDLGTGIGRFDRIDTHNSFWQTTEELSTDVRTQTEYGTLRAYTRVGFRLRSDTNEDSFQYVTRWFVQLGGFTAGKTGSFFDFLNGAFSFAVFQGGGSNSPYGRQLLAYTISYGNGISTTLSVEDPGSRRNAIWDGSSDPSPAVGIVNNAPAVVTVQGGQNTLAIGALPGPIFSAGTGNVGDAAGTGLGDYASISVPDLVASLRVDQSWGSAQIAGATHQLRAGFYGNDFLTTTAGYTGVAPKDEYGWAIMAGIQLNIPWNKGDKFWVEGTYTQGAPNYTGLDSLSTGNAPFARFSGNPGPCFGGICGSVAAGWALDAIFANIAPGVSPDHLVESGLHKTTAWAVGAAYEHVWTPAIRTSVYGHITGVRFDGTAAFILCNSPASPIRNTAGSSTNFNAAHPLQGCNPNFEVWDVGTRTIWNPVNNLDIGLDIIYAQINNHFDPKFVTLSFAGAGGRQKGLYLPADHESALAAMVRVQRNFWP